MKLLRNIIDKYQDRLEELSGGEAFWRGMGERRPPSEEVVEQELLREFLSDLYSIQEVVE